VRKTSLAKAKALRHGKPTAAVVPVEGAAPPATPDRQTMTRTAARPSVQKFIDEFSATEPDVSAVEDLLEGRR